VIIVGAFYVDTANWHPFIPNGFGGVMSGVSSVFFAYIGFDALSTTAEECKNPQKDLPRAMINAIIICTILYICISLVLTGMVPYKDLKVNDPLAYVFQKVNLKWFSGVIAVSAVFAMAGVFLVFQLGQPRIWMTMSRDGLLPKRFSHIHPRYKTPDFSTIITGLFVIIPMLFIPSDTVLDLCSMGTLFAFVLVCAGVLKLQITPDVPRGKFRIPYLNSKWIFPIMVAGAAFLLFQQYPVDTKAWLLNTRQMNDPETLMVQLSESEIDQIKIQVNERDSAGLAAAKMDLTAYLSALDASGYASAVEAMPVPDTEKYESGWHLFQHKIPMWLFVITTLLLCYYCFRYSLSIIPVLGLVSCFYMMAQIPAKSWFGFVVWLLIGLVIYFGYGYNNSKLHRKDVTA
jgi:amino acid transporter